MRSLLCYLARGLLKRIADKGIAAFFNQVLENSIVGVSPCAEKPTIQNVRVYFYRLAVCVDRLNISLSRSRH